jgi:hypothetical protein
MDRVVVGSDRKRLCVLKTTTTIVAINIALNIAAIVLRWGELSSSTLFFGVMLWLVLPFVAVVGMWYKRAIAHWIVIVLFGLRGVLELSAVISLMGASFTTLFLRPRSTYAIEALFYLGSALWLFTQRKRLGTKTCHGSQSVAS